MVPIRTSLNDYPDVAGEAPREPTSEAVAKTYPKYATRAEVDSSKVTVIETMTMR